MQEILDTCLQHNDDDDDNKPHRSDKSLGLLSTAHVGQLGGKSDVLLAQADPPLKRSSVVSEERAFRSLSARALSVDVDYPTPGQHTPPRLLTPVQDKPQRLTAAQEADLLEQCLTELRRQADSLRRLTHSCQVTPPLRCSNLRCSSSQCTRTLHSLYYLSLIHI